MIPTWTHADTLTPELVAAMNAALETIPGDFHLTFTRKAWENVQGYLATCRELRAANDWREAYQWCGPLIVGLENIRPWGRNSEGHDLVIAVRDAIRREARAINEWAYFRGNRPA